jgi:hypothetical protein
MQYGRNGIYKSSGRDGVFIYQLCLYTKILSSVQEYVTITKAAQMPYDENELLMEKLNETTIY